MFNLVDNGQREPQVSILRLIFKGLEFPFCLLAPVFFFVIWFLIFEIFFHWRPGVLFAFTPRATHKANPAVG